MAGITELFFPKACAGCGHGGVVLCKSCQKVWAQVPQLISTRVNLPVPVWSLGALGGVRRQTIINLKERQRFDVIPYLGAVLRSSVRFLQSQGHLDEDLVLVPAPTRRASARKRGGDIVARVCHASHLPTIEALQLLPIAKESVGLSATERRSNLAGAVWVDPTKVTAITGHVLLVDDVVTTGATLGATILALTWNDVRTRGALGWAHA